jgi:hypothetical protein
MRDDIGGWGTCWYKWKPDKQQWAFNHLSDYQYGQEYPTPKFESQRSGWESGKWMAKRAFIFPGNPVVVSEMSDPWYCVSTFPLASKR